MGGGVAEGRKVMNLGILVGRTYFQITLEFKEM